MLLQLSHRRRVIVSIPFVIDRGPADELTIGQCVGWHRDRLMKVLYLTTR